MVFPLSVCVATCSFCGQIQAKRRGKRGKSKDFSLPFDGQNAIQFLLSTSSFQLSKCDCQSASSSSSPVDDDVDNRRLVHPRATAASLWTALFLVERAVPRGSLLSQRPQQRLGDLPMDRLTAVKNFSLIGPRQLLQVATPSRRDVLRPRGREGRPQLTLAQRRRRRRGRARQRGRG